MHAYPYRAQIITKTPSPHVQWHASQPRCGRLMRHSQGQGHISDIRWWAPRLWRQSTPSRTRQGARSRTALNIQKAPENLISSPCLDR
ncbi:hypothetical protein CP532_4027 [Ophiocordyceps camponoti-leonardi (nom. inval.)]|nr:hypothetical protein CP532_4027 [Ophiocordyceps camponoti-leonardi (nom. inval.)]